MSKDGFEKLFVIIEDSFAKFIKLKYGENAKPNRAALRQYLGVSNGKFEAWKKGQWPSAQDCVLIEEKLGLSLRWLITGEGSPEGGDALAHMRTLELPVAKECGQPDTAEAICSLQQRVKDLEKLVAAQEEALALYRMQYGIPAPGINKNLASGQK